jgi:hypothetical protein
MSRLIGRKLLMRLGSGGGANRVRRFYRLLPRRVKSDRLLVSLFWVNRDPTSATSGWRSAVTRGSWKRPGAGTGTGYRLIRLGRGDPEERTGQQAARARTPRSVPREHPRPRLLS